MVMNIQKKFLLITLLLLCTHNAQAVTLVYNMKVRRVFNIEPVLERMKSRLILTAVPIVYRRKRHLIDTRTSLDDRETRTVGGSLLNLRYVISKHWWLEATTGIESDHGNFTGTDPFHASRFGFDDLVLAGGYRHFIGERGQCVLYGLVGIPTRTKLTLEDRHGPLVGTRLYGVGVGIEGSYSFISELKRSFAAIAQARIIHGFNRSWFPVLPEGSRIQPGNGTDLLFTLQFRERRTIIEGGFNATIFSNQAIILPTETVSSDTFTRYGGYLTLSHAIPQAWFNKPFIMGIGCSGNHTKKLDSTVVTAWIYGSIVF